MPEEIATVHDVISRFGKHPDGPAVLVMREDGIEKWTFAQLADHIQCLAAGLRQAGLEPGGRAALLAPNSPEWLVACFALIQAGAIPVLIDAQMGREALARVLDDSGASWVFSVSDLVERLPQQDGDPSKKIVLLDGTEDDTQNWSRFQDNQSTSADKVRADDVAVLFYTSGTSGTAKGVPLSHRNLASNVDSLVRLDVLQPSDRLLTPLPLHHAYPFTVGMLLPLACGIPIILPRSLSGPRIVRAMTEGEATGLIGVPRIYSALLASIEDRVARRGRIVALLFRLALAISTKLRDHTGWRIGRRLFARMHREFAPCLHTVVSGGSAIDPGIARKLEGFGWRFANGYGLTETSPVVAFNEPGQARIGTVGRPVPGVEVRIDEPESERPHGEILVRGSNVFSGYWNLPDETDSVFTPDGFFRTGDLGEFDEDGYLRILGRASSLIVLPGGENVWPEDVEQTLQQSEAVSEASVLLHEDKLVAVIVPQREHFRHEDPKAIENHVRREVARISRDSPSHHRVTDVVTSREPLARTRLGKIRRQRLKNRYEELQQGGKQDKEQRGPMPVEEMSPEDQALLDVPVVRQTWEWLTHRFPDARLTPETRLQADLGIDSMQWLQLGLDLQQHTGRALRDEAIQEMETVGDLLREMAEAHQSKGSLPEHVTDRLREPDELLDNQQRRWLGTPNFLIRVFGSACFTANRLILRGLFQLQVSGQEHALGQNPVIFAPNHRSYLDAPALAAALPGDRLRRTYWAGAVSVMFHNRLKRLFSRAIRVIPVDPRREPVTSIALATEALKRRNSLVWFPEGSVSRDGKLQPFQSGIGLLLQARPVTVVPVWIEGTHEALPYDSWRPRLRRVNVRFGEPLKSESISSEGAQGDAAAQRAADILHDRVAQLEKA